MLAQELSEQGVCVKHALLPALLGCCLASESLLEELEPGIAEWLREVLRVHTQDPRPAAVRGRGRGTTEGADAKYAIFWRRLRDGMWTESLRK